MPERRHSHIGLCQIALRTVGRSCFVQWACSGGRRLIDIQTLPKDSHISRCLIGRKYALEFVSKPSRTFFLLFSRFLKYTFLECMEVVGCIKQARGTRYCDGVCKYRDYNKCATTGCARQAKVNSRHCGPRSLIACSVYIPQQLLEGT